MLAAGSRFLTFGKGVITIKRQKVEKQLEILAIGL
jgi:hypothetical protein